MTVSAGIIARVSTGAQLDNSSPDEQMRRCREYCRERGYGIALEKTEAISGSFVLARSGFNELLTMAADGRLTVIVADIPDRLGRGETIAQLEILAKLNGARVEYAQPGRDTSTIEGFIQKSAEQMVSGIERMNIRRRTTEGRRAMARGGRVIRSRFRPFGFRFVDEHDARGRKTDCRLEIVGGEAETVRQIFAWCLEGVTSYGICKRLTEMRVPTLADIDGDLRKNRSRQQWAKSVIVAILKNSTYKGEWLYGKKEVKLTDTPDGITRQYISRPQSERIMVPVPAIVGAEEWEAAQAQLEQNRLRSYKPTRHQYLLRGRLRCARCEGAMGGFSKSPRKDGTCLTYYRCMKNFADNFDARCPAQSARGADLESTVWEKVDHLMKDDEFFFQGLAEQRAETEHARRVIEGSIAAKRALNESDVQGLARMLELYRAGGRTMAEYLADKAEVERKARKRESEIGELQAQLAGCQALTPEEEAELRRIRAKLALGAENATFDDKLSILDFLQIKCVYDDRTGDTLLTGGLGAHNLRTISRRTGPAPHKPFAEQVAGSPCFLQF